MIYYDIQHHGSGSDVKWLCELLSDAESIINISLDCESEEVDSLNLWLQRNGIRGFARRSYPVTWCGPSQLTQFRQSLQNALHTPGWEYYVNLSGVCFPLKTQNIFKKYLRYSYRQGIHSFMFSFVPRKPPMWILHSEGSTEFTRKKYLRLHVECTHDVLTAFDHSFHPVSNPMQRKAVFCTEIASEKRIMLRGLFPWEKRAREQFWKHHQYVIGRTWSVLHKKQVEWMMSDRLADEMYEHCYTMFEPDETYMPSLLQSRTNPHREGIENNNLRFNMGAPQFIKKGNISSVFESSAFFARKLMFCQGREHLEGEIASRLDDST